MIATDEAQRLLLSPRDVAARLGCGYRTARQMMIDGEWPLVTFGKRKRVPARALEQWIAEQTRPARKRR